MWWWTTRLSDRAVLEQPRRCVQRSRSSFADSDKAYDKALAMEPDNAGTLNNYAYYLSVRNEQLEKAERMSKRSLELAPGAATYMDTYAWILFREEKYAEARIWIEKALAERRSRMASWWNTTATSSSNWATPPAPWSSGGTRAQLGWWQRDAWSARSTKGSAWNEGTAA